VESIPLAAQLSQRSAAVTREIIRQCCSRACSQEVGLLPWLSMGGSAHWLGTPSAGACAEPPIADTPKYFGSGTIHDPIMMRFRSKARGWQRSRALRNGGRSNQLNAKARTPEKSRTIPTTATARKLLEANSSRMVHHLSRAPAQWNGCPLHSQRVFIPCA